MKYFSGIFGGQEQNRGQVLIITSLALGGLLLGATTVAGILMAYRVRAVTDSVNSAKSIFAADTGIEWGLYQFFKPGSGHATPVLSNGASFTVTCVPTNDCANVATTLIKSLGKSSNAERALDLTL